MPAEVLKAHFEYVYVNQKRDVWLLYNTWSSKRLWPGSGAIRSSPSTKKVAGDLILTKISITSITISAFHYLTVHVSDVMPSGRQLSNM